MLPRPRAPRARLVAVLLAGLVVLLAPTSARADPGWTWPLVPVPEVVHPYDPPDGPYGAGHRGVDLAGTAGQPVRAVADGTVRHVGVVAGVAVVSIDHGGEISTYQPVHGVVTAGDAVVAGQTVGHLLLVGSHCAPRACLHLGRRIDDAYADPLDLLRRPGAVRLVPPAGPLPVPPVDLAGTGTGVLGRPAEGPVTSAFGMRVHPITGVLKLHDGMDLGAPCGSPVRAAADGTVVERVAHPAYGNRLVLRHSGGLETSYNHLSRFAVAPGTAVRRGQLLGHVGTTGLSTGCHLHFMVERDGVPHDPARYL